MTTIQYRRGTAAEWTSVNPVLADGEPGLETDTDKMKTGDGVTAWNNLAYSTGTTIVQNADGTVSIPVTTVQGDTGDVRISLRQLDGVDLDAREVDEGGIVLEPGPTLGEFLGFLENGTVKNLPINAETLGLLQLFEPKDPNSKYKLYGYSIPRGGIMPADLPDVAWVHDENNPDQPLLRDVYSVTSTSSSTGVTLPTYLDYSEYRVQLGVANTPLVFPAAPTGNKAVVIDLVIDQDPTTGNRTVSFSSNVRWEKIGGITSAPTLETGAGARNRLRFAGSQGQWECIGRIAYAGAASAGPTPTFVAETHAVSGTSGSGATSMTFTYPATNIDANDIAIATFSGTGGNIDSDVAAIQALGWSFIDGPSTNHDTSPTVKVYAFKKKLTGAEEGTSVTFPFADDPADLDTTPETSRGALSVALVRGADFDRISYVFSRDTSQDVFLEAASITPPVNNSLLLASHHLRYAVAPATAPAAVPGIAMSDTTWTERADYSENRATTVIQYGAHLATKPLNGGANVEVTGGVIGSGTLEFGYGGFVFAIAPPNV